MLSAFRRLSKSAVGTAIMVLFLLAILASFALADMSNIRSGSFGMGGNDLAKIGSEPVTNRDFDSAMKRALNQARQQNPEATYASLAGQFDDILNGLIDEHSLLAFARDHGFILSKRLVDAEIANIPATRGLDGKFNQTSYAQFLQEQQMTDADLRRLIQVGLTQRLILGPAAVNARVPIGVARPYAAMLLEQREGQLALIPAQSFRAGLNPSDGDLQAYYAQNRQRYMVPEQRVLKVAKITSETVPGAAPTEAEIAAYYKANQATYAGTETRVISQAVVQDKRAADGIAARARGGAAFAASVAPAGLSAEDVSVGPQTRAEFTNLAGAAVANAAFSAARGGIVGPVRSDLGWHVIRVDDVRVASGRTLAQARGEIAAQLATTKRKEALTDLVTRIEDQIGDGASFAEAAAAAKLPVVTTPAIGAGGQSRSDPSYRFAADLAPALKAGFAMAADDDPEVVSLDKDAGFALVGLDRVIEAQPAPLAQIRDRVREDWIHRKALDRARAVATEIANKVAKGVAMDKALAEAKAPLPPVEQVNARRIQIGQANGDAVAPLRMLFSLTQGNSRLVADPRGRGFFIVKVNKIVPGNAYSSPALISQTQASFQQTGSDELAAQFLTAMKAEQGVKRNDKLIGAAKGRYTANTN